MNHFYTAIEVKITRRPSGKAIVKVNCGDVKATYSYDHSIKHDQIALHFAKKFIKDAGDSIVTSDDHKSFSTTNGWVVVTN